jgi:IclR family transcriptional regulator, pca regulon regulatory protein
MGESAAMTTKRPKAADPEQGTPMPSSEIAALAGDPDFMMSLARGIAVVRAFTRAKRDLTVAELARKTGISRASVRRCLYTLNKLGYVESDGRAFSLEPKILTLGYSYLSSAPLAEIAQPVLERVSVALQESCSLALLDGDEIVYIARSATRRIMSVALNVGSRLPAYCTSMGRVALAQLPAPSLEGYLARVKLRPLTARTVVSQAHLLRIIAEARREGFAAVDQELEIGLRSIAVPVLDAGGTLLAGMNVSAQASRVTMRDMERLFLPELRAAAQDLRLQLEGSGAAPR